jgi:hypothetical protein
MKRKFALKAPVAGEPRRVLEDLHKPTTFALINLPFIMRTLTQHYAESVIKNLLFVDIQTHRAVDDNHPRNLHEISIFWRFSSDTRIDCQSLGENESLLTCARLINRRRLLNFHFTLGCNYEGRKRKRRKSGS